MKLKLVVFTFFVFFANFVDLSAMKVKELVKDVNGEEDTAMVNTVLDSLEEYKVAEDSTLTNAQELAAREALEKLLGRKCFCHKVVLGLGASVVSLFFLLGEMVSKCPLGDSDMAQLMCVGAIPLTAATGGVSFIYAINQLIKGITDSGRVLENRRKLLLLKEFLAMARNQQMEEDKKAEKKRDE
jgi:hypothetical protein